MKKISLILLSLLLILLVAAGCSAGEPLVIELPGNPTTGYTWLYTADPEGIVVEVSNEYQEDAADEDMAGVGGTFIFTFEGKSAGSTTLYFEYKREWEDEESLGYAEYDLTVDSKGNVEIADFTIAYPDM